MSGSAGARILAVLAEGPLRVPALATALDRSASATRQALTRLEKKGSVARTDDHHWTLASGVQQDERPELATFYDADERPLTDAEIATQKVFVPSENLADLETRIEKLAKRSVKLGLQPVTLTVGDPIVVPGKVRKTALGPKRRPATVYYQVRIDGPPVRIAGWEFIARIDHSEGGLLNAVPTAELDENELKPYRKARPWCDHCDTERRRKDTFVVRATGEGAEPRGTLKQIGRNCLKDFLGHEDPAGLARLAQYLWEALRDTACSEPGGYGPTKRTGYSLIDFLSTARAFELQDGWCSRTKAREVFGNAGTSTADCAWEYLSLLDQGKDAMAAKLLTRNTKSDWEDYEAFGARTLERSVEILASKADDHSDYEHNLLVSIELDWVTGKTAGYVASLIGYVRRNDEDQEKRDRWSDVSRGSEFFGLKKERLKKVEVKVLSFVITEGYYGAVAVVTFLHEGNVGLCFHGGDARWLDVGKNFQVSFTIKTHKINTRGSEPFNETQVQRLKCHARKRGDGRWDAYTNGKWEAE